MYQLNWLVINPVYFYWSIFCFPSTTYQSGSTKAYWASGNNWIAAGAPRPGRSQRPSHRQRRLQSLRFRTDAGRLRGRRVLQNEQRPRWDLTDESIDDDRCKPNQSPPQFPSNGWPLSRCRTTSTPPSRTFGVSAFSCGSCAPSEPILIRESFPNDSTGYWKRDIAWKSPSIAPRTCAYRDH